ncbi:phage portal protein [Brevundimonas sp.]|uniref:phage portal protein n=1 Tax=Brevundimonas sp. TaxID=1871086 RepID=UPI0025BF6BBC|nr:phage portal protein [Brevundimonas sp.]
MEAKASPSVAPDAQDTESTNWLAEIFGVIRGPTGVSVTPESALRSPTAYACVAVLAQAVAQLPFPLHERTADGGKERATDHPVYALLNDQANEWTSAFEFRQSMMSSALRYDQGAFAWIGRAGGEIMELVQIPSASVSVETDPITREPAYKVTERNGRQRTYDRFDILHIRAMDGVAPLTAAREAIAIMTVMERHAAKLFGKGARPSGLLKAPKGLSVDAMKRAVLAWNKAHSGDGGGGTAFLESDWEWIATQLSSVDAQFMELRGQQVIEIARPFRIPPQMLQELGRATWGNTEHLGQQFLTLTLMPWLKVWEGAIRRSLLTREERSTYFAEFLVDDLVRADLAARMESYAKAITNGVLSPNEARSMENRAPYAGGEEFRRPMNTEKPGAANVK